MTQPTPFNDQARSDKPRVLSDELAYILPMGIFLAFTAVQGEWPSFYALGYVLKAIATAVALFSLWPHYTKIRWNAWWLGILVGVAGLFQWIAMQLYLQRHFEFFHESANVFNPTTYFHNRTALIAFICIRVGSAALIVPFMEELFWRDYLWRQILSPNNFKLAAVGEWAPSALLIVSGIFATVHGNWWLTAIVWALMVGLLLVYTKSLGACIVAHGTTNLLLGLYVLKFHAWSFW
jgi:CAAX prenyl protease-like protein